MSSPILDLNEYGSLNVYYTPLFPWLLWKMKSILHNRCCQLLCVVSSNRIFILFPFCSILCSWTNLNKNVFLKNPDTVVLAQGTCPTHRNMTYTMVWNCGKLFYHETSFFPNCHSNWKYNIWGDFFSISSNISLFEYNLGELIQHVVLKWKLENRPFHFTDWLGNGIHKVKEGFGKQLSD